MNQRAKDAGGKLVETAVAAAVAAAVILGSQQFGPLSAPAPATASAPAPGQVVTREEIARLSEQIRQVDERTRRIEDRLDNLLTREAR